ncbi:MAG: energy-coupling factor ABC transporter ATP-binding protein [Treponema sp.]|nr:energy-coupling factor ABC transporter ATP-binding protein [Treponema sp.]
MQQSVPPAVLFSALYVMNALTIKNLCFIYKNWTGENNPPVFSSLDFTVGKGEHVLLLAKPGSGKTTLARIVADLIPKFIDGYLNGIILIQGKNISGFEPYQLIQDICYISQNPAEMVITSTVENEIAFPLESMGIKRDMIVQRVQEALDQWGLRKFAKASPSELSGGERKRMLLAVATAIDAAVLLLDESFDDLDTYWRKKLSHLIQESDKTIIVLSARYLPQFTACLPKVVILENGQIHHCTAATARNDFTHKTIEYYHSHGALPTEKEPGAKIRTAGNHLLSVDSLRKTKRRKNILSEAPFVLSCSHFTVRTGEIIRLLGCNGSGKSTFSRILCGLDTCDTGRIELDGKKVRQETLNTQVGYLFQNPDFQIFLPTVYDELAWGLENSGNYTKDEIYLRVKHCAELFGLELQSTPATMSFALRKKLQAAVYYLLDRPFLILDELDGAMSYEDAYFITEQLGQQGAALLIITHDDFFAQDIADKTYRITNGIMESV